MLASPTTRREKLRRNHPSCGNKSFRHDRGPQDQPSRAPWISDSSLAGISRNQVRSPWETRRIHTRCRTRIRRRAFRICVRALYSAEQDSSQDSATGPRHAGCSGTPTARIPVHDVGEAHLLQLAGAAAAVLEVHLLERFGGESSADAGRWRPVPGPRRSGRRTSVAAPRSGDGAGPRQWCRPALCSRSVRQVQCRSSESGQACHDLSSPAVAPRIGLRWGHLRHCGVTTSFRRSSASWGLPRRAGWQAVVLLIGCPGRSRRR